MSEARELLRLVMAASDLHPCKPISVALETAIRSFLSKPEECCEWIVEGRPWASYRSKCGTSETMNGWTHCPFCGRKIKVKT